VRAVSRDEALAHAADIVAATPLPVTADLEGGYGDEPEDVALTIRMAAAVGLAGGSIEDATGDPRRPVYDHAQAVDRIVAAVEAAASVDGGFVLTARAENFLFGLDDLADTLRRLQAFAEAGAAVLYAPGLPELGIIGAVTASVDAPVNVLADARYTVAELAVAGVARITTGSALSNLSLGASLQAARAILDHGSFAWAVEAPAGAELEDLMRRGSRAAET
jgi:2-methylisocitrate lyase-like PEP mutase family enzyme